MSAIDVALVAAALSLALPALAQDPERLATIGCKGDEARCPYGQRLKVRIDFDARTLVVTGDDGKIVADTGIDSLEVKKGTGLRALDME